MSNFLNFCNSCFNFVNIIFYFFYKSYLEGLYVLLNNKWNRIFIIFFLYRIFIANGSDFIDKILIRIIIDRGNFLKWKTQYFLMNSQYLMAPRNLRYLQFVLDKNVKFSLENHPYPDDLYETRRLPRRSIFNLCFN